MNFSDALVALKDGKKIRRSIWGGYWYLANDVQAEHKPTASGYEGPNVGFGMENLIVAVLRNNGGIAPAQPYQADLLAEDWQIVE